MVVKTNAGTADCYEMEKVAEVYYEEVDASAQSVTVSGKIGDYTYVDLFLPSGNKWATYNVGADSETGFGDYFAWGEVLPKEQFSLANYRWTSSDFVYTKYGQNCSTTSISHGGQIYQVPTINYVKDDIGVLENADDAVATQWGGEWRMPTLQDMQELVDGCVWVWVENFNGSGVAGRLGTSKRNGNTIFLPASGEFNGEEGLQSKGSVGAYWSSTLFSLYPGSAYALYFDGVVLSADGLDSSIHDRAYGRVLRAVAAGK